MVITGAPDTGERESNVNNEEREGRLAPKTTQLCLSGHPTASVARPLAAPMVPATPAAAPPSQVTAMAAGRENKKSMNEPESAHFACCIPRSLRNIVKQASRCVPDSLPRFQRPQPLRGRG